MEDLTLILLVSTMFLVLTNIAVTIFNKPKTQEDKTPELKEYIKDEGYKTQTQVNQEITDLYIKFLEALNKSNKENSFDLGVFKDGVNKQIIENFTALSKTLNEQMNNINNKVDERLTKGFKQTNETFQNIIERLSKIDEAQKNIEKLSSEVVDLQHLLSDKKYRGTFGEIQLSHILESIFGESNCRIYETQYTLSNSKVVDALLHVPEPMGNLAIDSKFPLENYRKMMDNNISDKEVIEAKKMFKNDIKKHIDDIASKYIILTETANQAVMFIPAEAIFAEINAYHQDLVEYAQKRRVWMASPTTLMSFLTTVQVLLRNLERDKHAKIIQEELIKLSVEFNRYKERWDKLSRSIDTVNKDVKNIHTTTEKIGKRFNEIASVEIEDIIQIENK